MVENSKQAAEYIFITQQTLSKCIPKLNDQPYTKYIALKVYNHIQIVIDKLCCSQYIRCTNQNAKVLSYLKETKERSDKISSLIQNLVNKNYFQIRGKNSEYFGDIKNIFLEFKNLYQIMQNQLDIDVEDPLHKDCEIIKDNQDFFTYLDQKVKNAEQFLETLGDQKDYFSKINNDIAFIIFCGPYFKIDQQMVSDFYPTFCEIELQETSSQIDSYNCVETNISKMLNSNFQNSWQTVAAFVTYMWANPLQKQIILTKTLTSVSKKVLILKVIKKAKESNFQKDQVFILNQNGLSDDPNYNQQQQQQQNQNNNNNSQKGKLCKVSFGRKAYDNPIPNDIFFHPEDTKISRRQFLVKLNNEIDQFEFVCTSKVNECEFVVTGVTRYPLYEGTIFGIKDQIYFEITKLHPNKNTVNLNKKLQKPQSAVDMLRDITVKQQKDRNETNSAEEISQKQKNWVYTAKDFTLKESQEGNYNFIEKKEIIEDEEEEDGKTEKERINEEDDEENKENQISDMLNIQYIKKKEKMLQTYANILEGEEIDESQIEFKVQFVRKSMEGGLTKNMPFKFKKPLVIIAHSDHGDYNNLPLYSSKLSIANQLMLYKEQHNNEWYIIAPINACVTYQLRLSSETQDSSRPFVLRDQQIVQVSGTRFQVEIKKE